MSKGFNRFTVVMLWVVLAFMYIPIIAIIGMSFNGTAYGMFPYEFTLKWYQALFTTSNLLPACWLSLKFSFLVTVFSVIVGTLTSFGLQYLPPKWADRFNSVMQLPIIIPWLVTSISLLLLFTFIGLTRSYFTMFLGNVIVVLPYVVLLVNGRFVSLDRTPESAAKLLGASPVRVFFDITFPAILPGILAGGIMSLIVCFNNFVLQYYLSPIGVNTLPVSVFTRIKGGYQADLNALSAIIIVIAVAIVIAMSKLGYSAGNLFGGVGSTNTKKENK
ncbi:MAG: ABC transporter permease [Parasporobacterium sp.]|nr:ABC transporter permease [Parasporobacterium sp.]